MNKKIDNLRKYRQALLNQISSLTTEQLNRKPHGFSNNIIWNVAHLISAQQVICYRRAGHPEVVLDKYISPFLTNTKPERIINENEIREIKYLFIDTLDTLQSDCGKKIFNAYTPSPNILKVYGIKITSIEEALEFLLYHEGYHGGCVLALKHLV